MIELSHHQSQKAAKLLNAGWSPQAAGEVMREQFGPWDDETHGEVLGRLKGWLNWRNYYGKPLDEGPCECCPVLGAEDVAYRPFDGGERIPQRQWEE